MKILFILFAAVTLNACSNHSAPPNNDSESSEESSGDADGDTDSDADTDADSDADSDIRAANHRR